MAAEHDPLIGHLTKLERFLCLSLPLMKVKYPILYLYYHLGALNYYFIGCHNLNFLVIFSNQIFTLCLQNWDYTCLTIPFLILFL
jgi:hypothetical protein